MPAPPPAPSRASTRTTALAVLAALLLVLHLGLLAALASALAIQALHGQLCAVLSRRLGRRAAAAWAALLTVALVLLLLVGLVLAVHALWTPWGLPGLLDLLADTLDRLRGTLPDWLSSRLPGSVDELRQIAAHWLRGNARNVQRWGHDVLRVLAQCLVGLIIGLLAELEDSPRYAVPWMAEVAACWRHLVLAFSRFVGAQLRIAGVNTLLTGVFLLAALPLAGVHVPLAWTLVAFTFAAGFVPIVGNLASNGAILVAALTVSPGAALACLVFLLVVHKLEYFLNAHFVGQRTKVPAPVLLASMLVLEAAFDLPGLAAAPVLCAWVFLQFGPE